MKSTKIAQLATALVGGLVLMFVLSVPSAEAAPKKCEADPTARGCATDADPITLDITFDFGALTDDVCVGDECVQTTFTATGTVECGNLFCDFNSTSVTEPADAQFFLPSGLRDLLFEIEWRGTPINPDACFGSTDAIPVGSAAIDAVFLRRFHDGESPWVAHLSATALDVTESVESTYQFQFYGCDGAENCGDFAEGLMLGEYNSGHMVSIFAPGKDRQVKWIPCRCTISNTPDCPQDVPVPTPALRILVE